MKNNFVWTYRSRTTDQHVITCMCNAGCHWKLQSSFSLWRLMIINRHTCCASAQPPSNTTSRFSGSLNHYTVRYIFTTCYTNLMKTNLSYGMELQCVIFRQLILPTIIISGKKVLFVCLTWNCVRRKIFRDFFKSNLGKFFFLSCSFLTPEGAS